MKLQIQETADGSATLYRPDIDEHYHSVKGALTEAMHVYITEALKHRAGTAPLRVLEVGLGTGLNAALTAAHTPVPVLYYAYELYPLTAETVKAMHYDAVDGIDSIHAAQWNRPVALSERFTLHKVQADFITAPLPADIDVIYMDAFAPEKQPEMWTPHIMQRLFAAMAPGGVLTTYCAKGVVRRMLADAGFTVERIPGPPGGKREILRAIKK